MTTPQTFEQVLDMDCCRYIEGDREGRTYCGNERLQGSAYCRQHYDLCVVPIDPEKIFKVR